MKKRVIINKVRNLEFQKFLFKIEIMNEIEFKNIFNFFDNQLLSEINGALIVKKYPKKTTLISTGDRIRAIPLVREGLVKVFAEKEENELLYYYIKPNYGCIMTFTSIFTGETSKITAVSEDETELFLLPMDNVLEWVSKYPKFNSFFYSQFEGRFLAMMEMVNQAVFHKLDRRILEYLKERTALNKTSNIKISHREIANDLGSAREVVSRILKKFEKEGVIKQKGGIEIL